MRADANVVKVPSSIVDHVLVYGDTSRLQGLARDLLVLVADHVRASWEILTRVFLLARVIDANLRVWDTTNEARLRPRLTLGVPVAFEWPPPHGAGMRTELNTISRLSQND